MPAFASPFRRPLVALAAATVLGSSLPARAADPDDSDALSLTAAPTAAPPLTAGGTTNRLFVEGALGAGTLRDGGADHGLRRASLDFVHASSFAPGWRAVFSDRIDAVRPRDPVDVNSEGTVNSLREAYLSWQTADGANAVDVGRMNLRHGPAYGYNPTDFFRDQTLRVVTTTNPLSLRENRLGTAVLRGQRLWDGGSLAVAFSPKLASDASNSGASLDLGSTNHVDRGLAVLGTQWTDRISSQVLLYKESAARAAVGASVTAAAGDRAVLFVEGMRGREPDLLARATGARQEPVARNRLSTGGTWSATPKLAITAEYEYNGFALDRDAWQAVASAQPALLGVYLLEAQRRQDLASRKAYLLFATQKDLFVRNLDLTALLRQDVGDRSRLAWIELRQHFDKIDVALQYQQQSGRVGTEYWLYPDRRALQLLASYFF